MTFNEKKGQLSVDAQQALTRLIGSYRSEKGIEVTDAYDFIRLLSECAGDSIDSILPLIQELAELGLNDVMRAAGLTLQQKGTALPSDSLPPQVLAITYFVIADSLETEVAGALH